MTEEKFKQLESLLNELRAHIGYPYCVIPGYLQDGPHIGIYLNNELVAQAVNKDLQTSVENAMIKLEPFRKEKGIYPPPRHK